MPITKLHPTFTFDEDRLAQLRAVVPEAFADGRINWETLRAALGEHLEDDEADAEHFGLFWPGKRAARRLASQPSRGTLVPQPGLGVNEATTRNLFIEGDNLEVLKLLLKSYAGQVKLIYIDPPYNTGNDFIYSDDFTEPLEAYLRRTGQMDEEGQVLTTNTKAGGRFHSKWLDMVYPRLLLARQLLSDDGAIFISIDDNEVHNLRQIMNEVFGEENFIATIIWQKVFAPKNTARHFSEDHDYIVVYARDAGIWEPNLLLRGEEALARYQNPDDDPRGVWASDNLLARNYYSKGEYEVTSPSGKKYRNPTGTYWRVSYEKFCEMDRDRRIWWGEDGGNMPRQKRFLSEVKSGVVPQTLWQYGEVGHTQEAKKELIGAVNFAHTENVLNTLKPTRLLQRILQIGTDSEGQDIVMDFFSGSASMADAVLQKNHGDGGQRHFIMVQFPEPLPKPEPNLSTIADIGRERIRRVIARMQAEAAGQETTDADRPAPDLGFRSYRLARSHFKAWQDYTGEQAAELETLFTQFESPLVESWEPSALLTELLLLEGFPLDSRVRPLPAFTANTLLEVSSDFCAHRLTVCLDARLHPETLAALDLRAEDTFICLESALDDEAKLRLADRCNLKVV